MFKPGDRVVVIKNRLSNLRQDLLFKPMTVIKNPYLDDRVYLNTSEHSHFERGYALPEELITEEIWNSPLAKVMREEEN
jgi:hypothetical protein